RTCPLSFSSSRSAAASSPGRCTACSTWASATVWWSRRRGWDPRWRSRPSTASPRGTSATRGRTASAGWSYPRSGWWASTGSFARPSGLALPTKLLRKPGQRVAGRDDDDALEVRPVPGGRATALIPPRVAVAEVGDDHCRVSLRHAWLLSALLSWTQDTWARVGAP